MIREPASAVKVEAATREMEARRVAAVASTVARAAVAAAVACGECPMRGGIVTHMALLCLAVFPPPSPSLVATRRRCRRIK